MTFEDAQHSLLAQVRDRIRNGELTERGFARLIGISQPHAHNVLKGVRKLSPQIFDSILKQFHLSILDLVSMEELQEYLQRQSASRSVEVPFLDGPVGPGMPWVARRNRRRRYPLPFPSVSAAPELVMANLVPDPDMTATLGGADIALLDTSDARRSEINPEGLYVVDRGQEAVLRYIRAGARAYYLVSDRTMDRPLQWERIDVARRDLLDRIRARARWVGYQRNAALGAAQPGRLL